MVENILVGWHIILPKSPDGFNIEVDDSLDILLKVQPEVAYNFTKVLVFPVKHGLACVMTFLSWWALGYHALYDGFCFAFHDRNFYCDQFAVVQDSLCGQRDKF